MSFYDRKYMEGDQVTYIGENKKQELGGKIGVVHAPVLNSDKEYVIEFYDTKNDDSYIVHESSLKKYVPSDKNNGPQVTPRRRKREEFLDEESKEK